MVKNAAHNVNKTDCSKHFFLITFDIEINIKLYIQILVNINPQKIILQCIMGSIIMY